MVFKKMLSALGVGGPSVDTVLHNANVRPGEALRGEIHLVGGTSPAEIEFVALALATRVEVESGDTEYSSMVEFQRQPVAGAFTLAPGERRTIPFEFAVPWETPVTTVYGQHLRGMTMGLRTELSVAKAVDKSDLDPVAIHPLPAQERILQAFGELGFQFKNADLERGRLYGVRQQLPFYQEIEFYPPPYARGVNEIEVTFVAGPHGMDVVLEVDKRGGMFTSGRDAYGHLSVDYATAGSTDWTRQIDAWLRGVLQRRPAGLGGLGGPAAFGQHGHGKGHGYGRRGHGSGLGGAVAGAGAGFLGGLLAGEAFEGMFDGGE